MLTKNEELLLNLHKGETSFHQQGFSDSEDVEDNEDEEEILMENNAI